MKSLVKTRIFAAVLCLLLIAGLFGCGAPAEQTAAQPADTAQAAPEKTAAPTPTVTIEPELPEKTAAEEDTIDIEDIVAVDNGSLRITVKELYPNEEDGYGIGVELENFTADTWSITPTHIAVNGLAVDSNSGCELRGGQKMTHSFIIPTEGLAGYGITDFTDITLSFNVSNSSAMPTMNVVEGGILGFSIPQEDAAAMINWFLSSNLFYGPVHICPYGGEKVELYAREPQEGDRVLFESDAARVTMIDGAFDAEGGYRAQFYMENLTPLFEESAQRRSDLVFTVFHVEVNGEILPNPSVTKNIGQRSSAYADVTCTAADLAAAGIKEVKKIEAILHIADTETGAVLTQDAFRILP